MRIRRRVSNNGRRLRRPRHHIISHPRTGTHTVHTDTDILHHLAAHPPPVYPTVRLSLLHHHHQPRRRQDTKVSQTGIIGSLIDTRTLRYWHLQRLLPRFCSRTNDMRLQIDFPPAGHQTGKEGEPGPGGGILQAVDRARGQQEAAVVSWTG